MWPPPTNGMSADQLRQLVDIAKSAVEHTSLALQDKCAQEGHVWGDETESRETIGGEYYEEGDRFDLLGRGGWQGGEDVYYRHRSCTRCGLEQKARAIVQEIRSSPFK